MFIDPVISSRIKEAWAKLPPNQRDRIAPMLAKANQQAIGVMRTKVAPAPDPAIPRQALLAYAALNGDQDAVLSNLAPGVVLDVGAGGELWGSGKYQKLDPNWAEAIAVWLENLILGKHPFNGATPNTIPIPDDITIAIAGDWGAGDWRTAANPAPSTNVRCHMDLLRPNLTIHLGDVYYAGTREQEKHLLVNLWPQGSLGALTLNSNHEMYSGATPYFEVALGSDLFQLQQQRSFFALENTGWIIVGLDSAYNSDAEGLYMKGSLHPDAGPAIQVDFLKTQVAKGKKVIVLTHHNGLSEDGSSTTDLWSQVMGAFPPGSGPACWYWGQVHAGVVYKPKDPANVLCRCCGHGALPWGQASGLANSQYVAWYENRSAHDPDIPQRVFNGFAVLRLQGANLKEMFYDENGAVAWQS